MRAVRSAIVDGTASETFLGLTPSQKAAVFALKREGVEGAIPGDVCTATRIGPSTLLTARHCFEHPAVETTIESDGFVSDPLPAESLVVTADDERDVAVLSLPDDLLPPGDPLPWAVMAPSALPGELVEIAGVGIDRDGRAGGLEFAVAPVTGVSDRYIETAEDGACAGDSGGPLLVRAADGSVQIAGVLSMGARTCAGEDYFERVDPLDEWLRSKVSAPTATNTPCPTFGGQGRCFGELAVWCEAGAERAASCTGPAHCGWSTTARGYRCVTRRADPCEGVSDLGICDGKVARRCEAGVLKELECGECGGDCVISRSSGSAVCATTTEKERSDGSPR